MEALFEWLHSMEDSVDRSSLIGDAILYTLNQENYLRRYLDDGHLSIDNNSAGSVQSKILQKAGLKVAVKEEYSDSVKAGQVNSNSSVASGNPNPVPAFQENTPVAVLLPVHTRNIHSDNSVPPAHMCFLACFSFEVVLHSVLEFFVTSLIVRRQVA